MLRFEFQFIVTVGCEVYFPILIISDGCCAWSCAVYGILGCTPFKCYVYVLAAGDYLLAVLCVPLFCF